MKKRKKKRSTSQKAFNGRRRRRRSKDAYGTSFETLEKRNLLAVITVSTAADVVDSNGFTTSDLIAAPGFDGAISLREAIIAAERTNGDHTINFDPATFNGEAADVIRLQSALTIQDSIVIDAGDLGVVVSGDTFGNDALVANSFISDVEASEIAGTFDDNTDGVLVFTDFLSQNVTITGLTITGGNSSSTGGGVRVEDNPFITIRESTIAGNRAAFSGGGIHSDDGSVRIFDSSISGNVANNPNSFTSALGGGVASDFGTLSVYSSTISDNVAHGLSLIHI